MKEKTPPKDLIPVLGLKNIKINVQVFGIRMFIGTVARDFWPSVFSSINPPWAIG
jgi:hypothetical protein